MNVSPTPELEKFVQDTVAKGRCSSASEVVRASLRRFEEEENWKEYAMAKIAEGIYDVAADRIVDGETAMRRIRMAAQSQRATRKAS
jgi:antitoxin ParD1/3/4